MSESVTLTAAQYTEQRRLLGMLDGLWNDPEVGSAVRRKAKERDPTIVIPDDHPVVKSALAQLGATNEQLEALRNEYANDKTARQNADLEGRLRTQLGEVQAKRNLTAEGMDGVIKIMQERQIADPDAAALLYLDSIPKPKPTASTSRFFDTKADMYGTTRQDEKWEQLHTDPDAFFADVVNDVLAEMPVA